MKANRAAVIKEVEEILKNGLGNLVLINRPRENAVLSYDIVNKVSHSVCLIDDEQVEGLLIQKLLDQQVEIFDNYEHLNGAWPKNPLKPLFWPIDKLWTQKRGK
jgi:hypothetical protein